MGKEGARSGDWQTRMLWAATAIIAVIATWTLYGAGLFRHGGRFLRIDELASVGSYLSGLFTPLAIGWAARTFLLQRKQMVDTLSAMQAQLELQRELIETQKAQIDREKQLALEADDPALQIFGAGSTHSRTSVFKLSIVNHRATAQRLTAVGTFTNIANKDVVTLNFQKPHPLQRASNWEIQVDLPRLPNDVNGNGYAARIVVLAERLDGKVSEFVFEASSAFQFVQMSHRIAVSGLTLG